jgi:hypothetical protein
VLVLNNLKKVYKSKELHKLGKINSNKKSKRFKIIDCNNKNNLKPKLRENGLETLENKHCKEYLQNGRHK